MYADVPAFAVFEQMDRPFRTAHPHTLSRSATDEPTPHMFSPAWPEVRRYRRSLILELLSKYPVDGVQLDFIRWPYYGRDLLNGVCAHGYDEPLLDALRKRYRLADDFRPSPDDPRFLAARQELVTLFIRELREDMRHNGIDLPVGVYNSNTFGRTCSLRDVCQDWRTWDAERLVDQHHPMFYVDSLTRLTRAVDSLTSIKRSDSTVFGPLFLCEVLPPERGPDTMATQCREAARRMIKQGCDGLWLCRAAEIEKFGLWPVVKELSDTSLQAIRDESFDPLYENLVENGSFERGLSGWSAPTSVAIVPDRPFQGTASVRITLQQTPQTIEQSRPGEYHPAPIIDVRSLAFSFACRCVDLEVAEPPRLELVLTYANGEAEVRGFELDGRQSRWMVQAEAFRTNRKPPDRTLRSTQVRLIVPAGAGQVWLDHVELIRDPLDNPLFRDVATLTEDR